MLELKKQLIAAYMEFSEKCKCENCAECMYADAPLPLCEAYLLADFLVEYGLFTVPAVPGPADGDHNIMETCFHNGERYMKDKVIKLLLNHKKMFPCEADVVDCILNMLEGL